MTRAVTSVIQTVALAHLSISVAMLLARQKWIVGVQQAKKSFSVLEVSSESSAQILDVQYRI
jgi:hypothetical protein